MRVLICRDDSQLRRLDGTTAAIEAAAPYQQHTKLALLTASRSSERRCCNTPNALAKNLARMNALAC
jgi:hypothetical protein